MENTLVQSDVDFSNSFEDDKILEDFLAHHGTKNMKWGQRRYQNTDGSLTPLGRLHYGVGAARGAAGKVGSSIKKKINPSSADLAEKYAKVQEKNQKKALKKAIKEAKHGKKIEDMTSDEIDAEFDRLQKQQALKEYKKQNSAAYKAGQGAKNVASGTAEGVKLAAKGVGFTAKLAGKAVGPLVGLGGDLAMRGLRKAGENWVDSVVMTDAQKAKQKADMAKNLFDAAKNRYELDRAESGAYKRDEDARRDSSYSKDLLDAARNAEDLKRVNSGEYGRNQSLKERAENARNISSIAENRSKAAREAVDLERIKSGEYRTSQFLKDQAENARNQATLAEQLKKAYSANDEPQKKVSDYVDFENKRADLEIAQLRRKAALGDDASLNRLREITKATKK